MAGSTVRRLACLTALACPLVSLALLGVAETATANGSPTCAGRQATIVGTSKSETIIGTPEDDVIVAGGGDDFVLGLGGDDIICGRGGQDTLIGGPGRDMLKGQNGRDRLLGGAGGDVLDGGLRNDALLGQDGRDRLLGRAGDDVLRGGPREDVLRGGKGHDLLNGGGGRDVCRAGAASGPHYRCEDVPTGEPRNLAIAWSDLDGDHRFGPGDILIARLFDTNGDSVPSKGDTIFMGGYPTDLAATAFADWGVASHTLKESGPPSLMRVGARTSAGFHLWYEDGYYETTVARPRASSRITDQRWPGDPEAIEVDPGSPSRPTTPVSKVHRERGADERSIDVRLYP